MDEYIEDIIRYQCLESNARVPYNRVKKAIEDRLYREGLESWQIHGTGSYYEGLPLEVCNDLDVMYIHKDFPVVVHQQPDIAPPQGFLIYDINPSNPAYLTLRTVAGVEYSTRIQGSIQQSGNHGNISSSKFVAKVFHGRADIQEIHGPAGVGIVDPAKPEHGTMDNVYCLSCPSWPPCASEFLTRPRHHGWPPQSLIDKIQQAGCHVVPVGHPQSDNNIEWRWSFSVAEKEVLHNINHKMLMVMYALKAIKSKHWRPDESEVTVCSSYFKNIRFLCCVGKAEVKTTIFCSYFIKTACLWVGEETNQSSISMMDLCRKVIDWLATCYRTHKLPHYFIPEQNLILHLEEGFCNKVVLWLDEMNKSLVLNLLDSVLNADIIELYISLTLQIQDDYYDSNQEINEQIQAVKPGGHLYKKRNRSMMVEYSDMDDRKPNIYFILKDQIKKGMPAAEVISLPENILLPIISDLSSIVPEGFCDMFITVINRYLGLLYSCLYIQYKQSDEDIANTCKEKSISYYTQGLEMIYPDGWSDRGLGGYIRLATFYHLNGEREKLGETLEKLEPLLEWGRDKDIITHVVTININKERSLSTLPWKQDQELYTNVIEPCDDGYVYINPVVLGYYLLIRWLINESQEEQTSETRHKIQEYVIYIETIITDSVLYTVSEGESAVRILQSI